VTTDQTALPPFKDRDRDELRLTPGQWHSLLENRSFLERPDNRFLPPRRFLGRPVRIVPDDSWR
jgi:hypothetical protein